MLSSFQRTAQILVDARLADHKYIVETKIKTGDSMSNSLKALVACSLVLVFSLAATFGQSSHFDVTNMDTKASACTDFYQYANGGWLAANPIPAAYPAWGVANMLNEKNRDVLHEILEAAARNTHARKGSNEQKVGDYYASCMEEAKIEAEGLKPLQTELDLIAR